MTILIRTTHHIATQHKGGGITLQISTLRTYSRAYLRILRRSSGRNILWTQRGNSDRADQCVSVACAQECVDIFVSLCSPICRLYVYVCVLCVCYRQLDIIFGGYNIYYALLPSILATVETLWGNTSRRNLDSPYHLVDSVINRGERRE
jgi:hypothetical protein